MFNNNSAQILSQKTQSFPFSSTQQVTQTTQQIGPKPNIFQQNTLQTQQTQQTQQPLQNNQGQYQNYVHEQELLRAMSKIYDISRNEELVNFLTVIDRSLEQTYGIIIRAYKTGETVTKQTDKKETKDQIKRKQYEQQYKLRIKQKYTEIKQKNLQLLKAILNLRKKMMNRVYMEKVSVPAKEVQLQKITEKISMVSSQIKQKLEHYHFSRQLNPKKQNIDYKEGSVHIPLLQLKAASEKLCRQTIKIRQQLKLCIEFLNGNDL